jgi:NAD(P)-dependent dehydrogenase (short-subunit alcohol dehydrogenase family)
MNNQSMLREGSLNGKVILVTGGGTGLGKSMVIEFLKLGAKVAICSRKIDVLEQAAEEMRKETGGEVLEVQADVRKYDEVENVISKTLEKFGRIDVLVNNAAGNFISPTERLSHRAFDTVVDIVLKGSYNFTLALGKHWIAQKQAANVLSIVTTYAWTGSGYVVPSACAKAGVLAMTRSLASEWGKYNIRLNAIAPGPFPTDGAFNRLIPKNVQTLFDPAKKIPVGRYGDHQELANLAAYLVSDFAGFVNGEVVTIDGGEWINGAGEFNAFNAIPEEAWDAIEQQVRNAGKK